MNTRRHLFAVLLTITLPVIGVGCGSVQLAGVPPAEMTIRQAQQLLVDSLSDLLGEKVLGKVYFTRLRATLTVELQAWAGKRPPTTYVVTFTDLGTITIRRPWCKSFYYVESDDKIVLSSANEGSSAFDGSGAAKSFAIAIKFLKDASSPRSRESEEADFTAFGAAAKTWLAAEPRPAMSDEARASKAMAEDAFKRKDFVAALEAYLEGLGRHPMWPEGHYNAALLAAETEDYEIAARHMRRYLLLAPDAKDASAAKDKYLLWQRKAKQ